MNKSLIIFGIVNITSDSFSDGGRYLAVSGRYYRTPGQRYSPALYD
ncbi:hypothetical protein GQL49_27430 [Escherichia coli]|nr:hypothetical protein [Salmonella enterica subsp. enterica serovar Mbandaka]EFH3664031.1 hypothetical protein [Escherichia coli]